MRRCRRPRCQGLTENIITTMLVAIAVIGAVSLFGNELRSVFATSADVLAGVKDAKYSSGGVGSGGGRSKNVAPR